MDRNVVVKEFQTTIPYIFKGNLCFAFIFGSVAKEKETDASDIDMFVCTINEPSMQQKTDFNKFYMSMHQYYGCKPDEEYPGEVVSLDVLTQNINYIEKWVPQKVISTYREFEAIFWTAVMAEKKIAIIDKREVLDDMVNRCYDIVKGWKVKVSSRQFNTLLDELSLLEVLTEEGYQFSEQHRTELEDTWETYR